MGSIVSCDINCDMGEGIGNDEALMPFITSSNIACGYHAGDEDTMKKLVDLCLRHNVHIGAHPSYPDRENFGRKDLLKEGFEQKRVYDIMTDQIFVLQKIAKTKGAVLHHVKPHGALYNRAASDREVALLICKAIKDVDPRVALYGLSGSEMKYAAEQYNLKFSNEVFADRTYQEDGSLTPRTSPNALIEDETTMIKQIQQIVTERTVKAITGKEIKIEIDTICVHGDGQHAIEFAKKIHQTLTKK